MAIQNRLSTCDRMSGWSQNHNGECILCRRSEEARNHLLFECNYSTEVWHSISLKLLESEFTPIWEQVVVLLTSSRRNGDLFLLRYAFQASVYHLWKERNQRMHGKVARPSRILTKIINKNVINRINSIFQTGAKIRTEMMERWLATRLTPSTQVS